MYEVCTASASYEHVVLHLSHVFGFPFFFLLQLLMFFQYMFVFSFQSDFFYIDPHTIPLFMKLVSISVTCLSNEGSPCLILMPYSWLLTDLWPVRHTSNDPWKGIPRRLTAV